MLLYEEGRSNIPINVVSFSPTRTLSLGKRVHVVVSVPGKLLVCKEAISYQPCHLLPRVRAVDPGFPCLTTVPIPLCPRPMSSSFRRAPNHILSPHPLPASPTSPPQYDCWIIRRSVRCQLSPPAWFSSGVLRVVGASGLARFGSTSSGDASRHLALLHSRRFSRVLFGQF